MSKQVLLLQFLFFLSSIQLLAQIQVGSDIYGTSPSNRSGDVVSMSAYGNRIAIGEKFYNGIGAEVGRVRVFELINGQWTQMGSDLIGEAVGDRFGEAISLSTNGFYLAVSASRNNDNGIKAGHVRVFNYTGGDWVQMGTDIDGLAAGDGTGSTIAISKGGLSVAIGSPYKTGGGDVRILAINNGTGDWVQYIPSIVGSATNYAFGKRVDWSADGKRLMISSSSSGSTGQVQVYRISGITATQLGTTLTGDASSDYFGEGIAISQDGQHIAIGAYGNDTAGAAAGQTKVYSWSGSAWVQVGTDIYGEAVGDEAGRSVALSADGSRLLIGAPQNDAGGSGAGHMRLYEWNGSIWVQIGTDIDGESSVELIGKTVTMSGDGLTIAAGSVLNDDFANNAGATRVFSFPENCTNSFNNQLGGPITSTAIRDHSGTSIDISADGSRIVIGAPYHDYTGYNAGMVRIMSFTPGSGGSWGQFGTALLGQTSQNRFGNAVAISDDGSRVAAGAHYSDTNGSNAGKARVFERTTTSDWTQIGTDIDGLLPGDFFGESIDISGDGTRIVVGAYQILNSTNAPGYARAFEYISGNWVQLGPDIIGANPSDQFGQAVTMSYDGSRLAVGARDNSDNGTGAGHVRVFEFSAGVWTQLGTDIYGIVLDHSGKSISLSADGNRIAVSTIINNTYGKGAGKVEIYDFIGGTWTLVGNKIHGEAADERMGVSVSLSADGSRIAIGASGDSESKRYAGSVSIFEFNGVEWIRISKILNDEENADFGFDVALSADGQCVAGSAPDSSTNHLEGGEVRVFKYETDCVLKIQPKVFLQGPYDAATSRMNDNLNITNLIPTTDPYGSGATITSATLNGGGSGYYNDIIDWVQVELRSAANNTVTLETQSALLQADGDVVGLDGYSPLLFDYPKGNYHIVVRHRNHLSVMNELPIYLETN